MHQFFNYNIMKFWLKINGGRDRRSNYAIMVVSNSSYASAKALGLEGGITSSSHYGQLLFTLL